MPRTVVYRHPESAWTAQDYWRFRAATWIAGRLLVWSAKFALKKGDPVEFHALRAAVEAGNTGNRRTK